MFSSKWQFWLGAGVSVLLLLILLYQVDLGELRDVLGGADYALLAPAIAIYFVAVLFRAVRWRFLLRPLRAIPVMRLYPVVIIGYMANNLLPVRLGEVVRSYYLARQENFSTSPALATVAVERIFDGITLLTFAAVSGPVLLLLGEFDGAADVSRSTGILLVAVTAAVFTGFLVFFTLLTSSPRFSNLVESWLVIFPARVRPKVREVFYTFVAGLTILNSPRKQAALLLLSMPIWLLEGAMYFMLAYSFNIDAQFGSVGVLLLVVTLLTATSNLATSVPSAIGGIGPFEVVAQQTLMALGVGASLAGAYAGFVHLVALWLPVNLVGLALLWKNNLSLKQLMGPRTGPELEAATGSGGRIT